MVLFVRFAIIFCCSWPRVASQSKFHTNLPITTTVQRHPGALQSFHGRGKEGRRKDQRTRESGEGGRKRREATGSRGKRNLKAELVSQVEGAANTAQRVAEGKTENLWRKSRRTLKQQRKDTTTELHIRVTPTRKKGL